MALRDHPWEPSYATSDLRDDGVQVDLLHDFYIPVLRHATAYDRVAGYFTSSSLAAASQGLSSFVNRQGRARFVVGLQLETEDVAAILRGDQQRASASLHAQLDTLASWPDDLRHGVELLAWMVAHGYLTIRVGMRVHVKDGSAQTFDFSHDGYLHEKWAIFGDGQDELLISGSLNESFTALTINAENIIVQPSWEPWHRKLLVQKKRNFEALWSNQHHAIKTFSLPAAVKARLIGLAGQAITLYEIDGTAVSVRSHQINESNTPTLNFVERLRFAMIRLAPLLPGGEQVGIATTSIDPWPHQHFVVNYLLKTYPRNHLLCDEVGLGKTIEAGLLFRALWLSGWARSIRVFAPAALTSQWLVEMAEKFLLPFVRRTNRKGDWERIALSNHQLQQGSGQLFDQPLEIISTGLLIHGQVESLLAACPATDVILVDEAHKARRHQPDQDRTLPRFNKLYQALEGTFYDKAEALLLATATPMQINQVEAFDLVKLMPCAGAVQFSQELCQIFYRLREQLITDGALGDDEQQWLRRYLNNMRISAPEKWDFSYQWVLNPFGQIGLNEFVQHGLRPLDWTAIQPALTQLAPLGCAMLRHNRSLLRCYQRQGRLQANLAWRQVMPIIIPLEGTEREIYDQLQDYCSQLSCQIADNMGEEKQRAAIGFYLSFLRRRYASSFDALRCSLKRRLDKIQQTLDHKARQWAKDGLDREALEELSDDEIEGLVLKYRNESDLIWERDTVSRLLETMQRLPVRPRKLRQLLAHIEQRRIDGGDRVRQLVLFTQYTDTLNSLYEELRRALPESPIATFAGTGATLRPAGQVAPETFDRTTIKQRFVAGHIDILLCTDAAAEGLNLQSADLLINFDLPWNPMLLEQRIGRIDRIGQVHHQIFVYNYLYQGSVEEAVYSRLVQRFDEAIRVSGELQFSLLPIQPEDFEDYAKAAGEPGKIDDDELLHRADLHTKQIKARHQLTEFHADEQQAAYEALAAQQQAQPLPASLSDIWRVISTSEWLVALGGHLVSFSQGDAFCCVNISGIADHTLLTTSRQLFQHGLAPNDPRPLHFATYGDPVFERLLDWALHPLPDVQKAWQARTPLAAVRVGGDQLHGISDTWALKNNIAHDVELIERTPAPPHRRDDHSGRYQKAMLYQVAARLAQMKLSAEAESVSNQIANIDRLMADVNKRATRRVRIEFDLADRHGLLAYQDRLLWPLHNTEKTLIVEACPLLLQAARDLIYKQLNAMSQNTRTAADVARRLRQLARY